MGACCSNELIKPRESTEHQTPAELNSVFGAAAPLNGIENTNNKGGQKKKVATSAARAFLAAVSRRSGTAGPADTVRGRGPATPPPSASVSHSPGNGSFVFTSMNMTATMTHNDGLPPKTNLTSHPSSAPATTTGASAVTTTTTTTYYYNTNQRKMVPRTRTSQSDLGIVTAAAPVIFPAARPHNQRPRGYDSMLGTPVSTATTARLAGLSPGTQSRGITPSSRSPGGRFFSLSPAPQPGMRLNSQFAPFGPDEEDDASRLEPPALPDFHHGGEHHDDYDHHDDEEANSTPRSPAGGGGTARGDASGRGQWRADDDTAAVALSMAALAAAMGGGGNNTDERDVGHPRIAGGVLTSSSTSGGILSAGGGGGGGEHSHDDVLRGSTTAGSSPAAAAAAVSPFPYRLYEVARGSGSHQASGVSSHHPSAATTPSVSPSRPERPSNPLTGGSSESSEAASPTRLFARRGTAAFVDADEVDAVAAAAAAHAASRDGSEGPTATSSTRLDDSSSAGWAARSNGGGSVPLSPSLRSGLRGKSMTPVALSPAEKKSVRFAF